MVAALTILQEIMLSNRPDRIIVVIEGLQPARARTMANFAVSQATAVMPKMSGRSAHRVGPTYGQSYFGIKWQDSWVWFQENGIKAFTMNNLAGRTIPMWIDDPTGQERARNPRAQVRTTVSGKQQILIFRKAANAGQRTTKSRRNRQTGTMETYDAPASYPGAPGRIGVREAAAPRTTQGKVGGQVARGNIGVRWRHPGLQPRYFLNNAMALACLRYGVHPTRAYVSDYRWQGSWRNMRLTP